MTGWLLRTLIAALLVMVPIQGMRPLVSYRALELGAGALDLGVVAGSYALLSFVFAAPIGRWVDRIGEPRFLLAGTTLITSTAFALSFVRSIPALVVAQAILGLGQVLMLVSVQTLVANGGGKQGRDARFGLYTIIGSLAQMIGPVLAGLLFGSLGLPLGRVFLLAAVPCLLGILMSLTIVARPPARTVGTDRPQAPQLPFFRSVGYVMRQPSVPHAMLASSTVLATIDLLLAYLPAYGEQNGIPAATIGLLLGIRAAASLASRLMMIALVRRWTRKRVLVRAMVLPALALLALPFTTQTAALAILLAIAGYGLGLGQPLSMAWVADQVPRNVRGMALGVRVTGNRLAQFVAPIAVGAIAGATGVGAIFTTCGILLGVSSWGVARSPTDGSRPDDSSTT